VTSDSELLRIEIETLWTHDERGRLVAARRQDAHEAAPHLVVGVAPDGATVTAIGRDVPDALADELLAEVARSPRMAPSEVPAAFGRCEQLLRDALGDVETSGGPSYLIPRGTTFAASAEIQRSEGDPGEALRRHRPDNWRVDEWQALLNGALGPWAIATIDGAPVSMCHSARLSERGAEAGVWTAPEHRGRGYAAAVTADWAALLAPSGRHLFYSTSADNASSQRVAARLGLRPIGWTWRLSARSG
jgi:RimJ/RimL family protein N-acetyltransferase